MAAGSNSFYQLFQWVNTDMSALLYLRKDKKKHDYILNKVPFQQAACLNGLFVGVRSADKYATFKITFKKFFFSDKMCLIWFFSLYNILCNISFLCFRVNSQVLLNETINMRYLLIHVSLTRSRSMTSIDVMLILHKLCHLQYRYF